LPVTIAGYLEASLSLRVAASLDSKRRGTDSSIVNLLLLLRKQ